MLKRALSLLFPDFRGAGGFVVSGDNGRKAGIDTNIFYIPHASEEYWWKKKVFLSSVNHLNRHVEEYHE